ncbi:MAG: DNA polymerase III subunit alpha [Campylobacterales bacterium]|nr:DNA polymerase III subunit alpha [Campylobacterales bacterium]
MSISPFTHLHLHTEYSLLDGANKLKPLAKKLKSSGMTAVAMTDHGNMFGTIDFYKTMKNEGIKPIIGLEAYIHNSDDLDDKTTKQRFHLCLYAKNEIGYKNLMYLSSMSFIEGFYYYPRINKKLLKAHSEGLICSSACLQGEVNWHLNLNSEKNRKNGAKGYERALEVALEYKEIFGDDFYLEIMRHGINDQLYVDEQIIKLSLQTGIKIIATNDTHYLEQGDAKYHEAFMCISTGAELDDPKRLKHSVSEFYLKTTDDVAKLYFDIPEVIENTKEIVDKCNLELKLGNPIPPKFKFTVEYAKYEGLDFLDDDSYFEYKCKKGLEKRLEYISKELHKEYKERLDFEIKVIQNMKFSGYMLIVWDFVREAKEQNIPVGPGRGSVAGSLVAYALEITNIDPIKYNLLFERFLNPERVSMPDIDMDFCQEKRGDIINYVTNKYGRFNVAQVITFGTLLAKGVIRDAARVLGVPYASADKMAKLIPNELNINLEKAYDMEPKIKELIESDKQASRVWEFALKLEGLKRNAGTHAAGVVISNEELWHKTPLYKPANDDFLVTQYSLNYLEDVDLIKFDFLGLKTLTVIDNALKLIKQRYNKVVDFNTLEMDDFKIFETIQSGNTLGLFQIESKGMQDLNKRLKPTTFEDIIAVLALYRPGPMESGMLDQFIERKHGREEISYFYDEFTTPLTSILEATYGVIVYQEQVMQIVREIGGFSLGESDIIRRAMGKKKADEMAKYKEEFGEGAKRLGFNKENAIALFDLIESFAKYGFNKSHSAAYAMITYQTAYLKTYYPHEFMAALLTSEKDNTDKVMMYIEELKRLKIKILPPDINSSSMEFSVVDVDGESCVRFGLGAIKGVGEAAIDTILSIRKEKSFDTIESFLEEIDTKKVNKKVLESLIKSGTLDKFNYSRRALLEQLEMIIEKVHDLDRLKKEAVGSLFGDDESIVKLSIELENKDEYPLEHILELEKETLGIYVSGHPLDRYRDSILALDITLASQKDEIDDGSSILIAGLVSDKNIKIKNNNKFGIVTIEDLHGKFEIMMFSKMLEEIEQKDSKIPLAFKVDVSKTENFTRFTCRKILEIDDAKKEKSNIKFVEKKTDDIVVEAIEDLIIELDYRSDVKVLDRLYSRALSCHGNKRLNILIKSKLIDLKIITNMRVGELILDNIETILEYK